MTKVSWSDDDDVILLAPSDLPGLLAVGDHDPDVPAELCL